MGPEWCFSLSLPDQIAPASNVSMFRVSLCLTFCEDNKATGDDVRVCNTHTHRDVRVGAHDCQVKDDGPHARGSRRHSDSSRDAVKVKQPNYGGYNNQIPPPPLLSPLPG